MMPEYCTHGVKTCRTCLDLLGKHACDLRDRIYELEVRVAGLEPDAERYRILCQESLYCWREGNGVGLVIPQQWHSEAQELKEHCDEHVDAFVAETKRLMARAN